MRVMDEKLEKLPNNVPGDYFVSTDCDGCAYCVSPCPYEAITLVEYMKGDAVKKVVEVNEVLCKGCGVCMATCPKEGIVVRGFKFQQISAQLNAALGVEA